MSSPVSTHRKFIFALATFVMAAGLIEGAARWFEAGEAEQARKLSGWTWEGRSQQGHLAQDDSPLAPTVRYNAFHNPLLEPDPELLYRVRSNPGGGPLYDYTGIGPQGFRGPEWELDSTKPQLLILGDSCGFGWSLRLNQNTFAEHLRTALPDWQVLNLSQPGYSSTQGRALLERWLPKLRPKAAVLYFGWNDGWQTPWLDDRSLMETLGRIHGIRGGLQSHSAAFRAGSALARGLMAPREMTAGKKKPRVSVPETLRNLVAMQDALVRAGANVVFLPPIGDANAPKTIEPWARGIAKHFSEDLVTPPEIKFLKDGYHPAPEAGPPLAAAIIARLAEKGAGVTPLTDRDLSRLHAQVIHGDGFPSPFVQLSLGESYDSGHAAYGNTIFFRIGLRTHRPEGEKVKLVIDARGEPCPGSDDLNPEGAPRLRLRRGNRVIDEWLVLGRQNLASATLTLKNNDFLAFEFNNDHSSELCDRNVFINGLRWENAPDADP